MALSYGDFIPACYDGEILHVSTFFGSQEFFEKRELTENILRVIKNGV